MAEFGVLIVVGGKGRNALFWASESLYYTTAHQKQEDYSGQ